MNKPIQYMQPGKSLARKPCSKYGQAVHRLHFLKTVGEAKVALWLWELWKTNVLIAATN